MMLQVRSYQFILLFLASLLLFLRSDVATKMPATVGQPEPLCRIPAAPTPAPTGACPSLAPAAACPSLAVAGMQVLSSPAAGTVLAAREAAVPPDWACGASLGAASPSAVRADIALAVQGSAGEMQTWIDLRSVLASSERVSLFVLSYDAPMASANCSGGGLRGPVVCLHLPQGSTWTTGRNALARAIFDEEIAQGATFRYWIFADADQISMTCSVACVELGGLAMSKCCIDGLLANFLGPLEFATLGITYSESFPEPAYEADLFMRVDCSDAQFYAVHRDAVPIVLPYFAELDEKSWWSSQAIMYRFTGSCLRGGSVLVKVSGIPPSGHVTYPKGRYNAEEDAVIMSAFPKLFQQLGPWPIRLESSEMGDCGDVRHHGWVRFRASDPAHVRFSASWKTTMEYAACLNETRPRFCNAMRA